MSDSICTRGSSIGPAQEALPGLTAQDAAPKRRARRTSRGASRDPMRHGFYARTFTAEEMRRLDAGDSTIRDEMNLLRTKVLRLARLTPLKKISDNELEAVIKLIRVVAEIDALERTQLMRLKIDATADPALEALAGLDPDDL